eukprot:124665_1
MAVIGSFPPDVFTSIFRRVNDQQTERLSAAEHAQYFTVDLTFRLHAPAQAKACGLARGLRKKFAAAVAALYPATGGPLNDLQETLSRLGVAHQDRVNSGHGYLLHVAVLPLDRRLVIELDGPTRFLHQNRRPTGWTVLKRRSLRDDCDLKLDRFAQFVALHPPTQWPTEPNSSACAQRLQSSFRRLYGFAVSMK